MISLRLVCYSTLHHIRKFTKFTLDTAAEDFSLDDQTTYGEEKSSLDRFLNYLRHSVLRKLAEFRENILPHLKETKLRIENYIELSLENDGKLILID